MPTFLISELAPFAKSFKHFSQTMPKQQLIGDELDAETLQLLNEVGGYYNPHQTRRLDDIFDTSWLDEFVEDFLGG